VLKQNAQFIERKILKMTCIVCKNAPMRWYLTNGKEDTFKCKRCGTEVNIIQFDINFEAVWHECDER
jgi:tRNA(Ile2) C34 agmatinyltransferase TiaS